MQYCAVHIRTRYEYCIFRSADHRRLCSDKMYALLFVRVALQRRNIVVWSSASAYLCVSYVCECICNDCHPNWNVRVIQQIVRAQQIHDAMHAKKWSLSDCSYESWNGSLDWMHKVYTSCCLNSTDLHYFLVLLVNIIQILPFTMRFQLSMNIFYFFPWPIFLWEILVHLHMHTRVHKTFPWSFGSIDKRVSNCVRCM